MMLGATLLLRLLPYAPPVGLSAAVLGVLAASVVAALLGYGWLRLTLRAPVARG